MWSTERPIEWIRSGRHAQIEGLTQWTTGMPRAFSFASSPRLKSGASTPMKSAGRSAASRLPISERIRSSSGSRRSTST